MSNNHPEMQQYSTHTQVHVSSNVARPVNILVKRGENYDNSE